MSSILVIDDDNWYSEFLSKAFSKRGHAASTHGTVEGAREKAMALSPDVVFLDVCLTDGNGLDLLPLLASMPDSPEVIIVTGLPGDDGAKTAITLGAWDYICKSDPVERIFLAADRALRYRMEKLAAVSQGGCAIPASWEIPQPWAGRSPRRPAPRSRTRRCS